MTENIEHNPVTVIREALESDIPAMHRIRLAVKENILSNPALVKYEDYLKFISPPNKGWICLVNDHPAGFAIVDQEKNNVWALFVDPDYERSGIGRKLHDEMLDWYFRQTKKPLWLSTQPGTEQKNFITKPDGPAPAIMDQRK